MSVIDTKQLSFVYEDAITALDRIDLHFGHQSKTALVGPNGAGKTTLLLAMAGLISFSGIITINKKPLNQKSADNIRKSMSFVFQNPDDMLFMPRVIEDVCFGLEDLGLTSAEAHVRGLEALQQVGLEAYENRPPHHLSYGEKRKVCLAATLARRSDIILFDEPTRELDPWGRRNFIHLFQELNSTLILATHDLELVLETCDQMVLLDRGKEIVSGTPEEILGNANLMEKHRLEVPHSLTRHPHHHLPND